MRALVYLSVTLITFFFLIGMWWTLRQIEERKLWTPPPATQIYVLAPKNFFSPPFREALLEVENIELLPVEYDQQFPSEEERKRLQIPPALAVVSGAQALEWAQGDKLPPLPPSWVRRSEDLVLDFRHDLGVGKDFRHFFPIAWEVLPGIDDQEEVLWFWVYGLTLLSSTPSETEVRSGEKLLRFLFSPAGNSRLISSSSFSSTSRQVEDLSQFPPDKKPSHLRSQSLQHLRQPRSLPAGGTAP